MRGHKQAKQARGDSVSGRTCDDCFTAPSTAVVFTEMASVIPLPIVPGESVTNDAAMDRALNYSKKAAKLFEGRKIVIFDRVPDSADADNAWEIMVKLQNAAENCCSTAAILVNRNRSDSGLKGKPFKPLRFCFRFAIIAQHLKTLTP